MDFNNPMHFQHFMASHYGINVNKEQIGIDSVILDKEELDVQFIPKEIINSFPKTVMTHNYIYNNEEEWILCIATNANNNYPLFLVCIKDGKKVYEEFLVNGDACE